MDKWWDYMTKFEDDCFDRNHVWEPDCWRSVMFDLGIDRDVIEKCIPDSFDGPDPLLADNSKFKAERKLTSSRGIYSFPEVIINGQIYRVSFLYTLVSNLT